MKISETLKQLRLNNGLTQAQLAKELKVSRSAIARWESEAGVPDIGNLIAIKERFGLSLDELVFGHQETTDTFLRLQEEKQWFERLRWTSVRLVALALALVVFTKEIFRASWLMQLSLALITLATLLTNRFISRRLHDVIPTGAQPLVGQQYAYALVFLLLMIIGSYRLATVADGFSKLVAGLVVLISLIFLALCLWGVRFAKAHHKND